MTRKGLEKNMRNLINSIPKRFVLMTFGLWKGKIPDNINGYKKEIIHHIESGNNVYIYGDVGSGKTHLVVALMGTVTVGRFLFINAIELLNEIRATFDFNRNKKYNKQGYEEILPDTDAVIDKYSKVELLVIDDLGAEKGSEWVIETLFMIINRRYEDMKPMFVTSNLSPSELAEKLGDRFMSRLCGHDTVIEKLSGDDYRFKTNEKE